VRSLKLPKRSPNLDAVAERFVWSIKHRVPAKLRPPGQFHILTPL
jgi:hypothetical protein